MAAARAAASMWAPRPGFVPPCDFSLHSCASAGCEMVPVEYSATSEGGEGVARVRLGPRGEGCAAGLIPIWGCPQTGRVHFCGEGCESRATRAAECPLSGLAFEGELCYGPWRPPAGAEKRDAWKLNPWTKRRGSGPRNDVAENLGLLGAGESLRLRGVEEARRGASLAGKAQAFDVAFAVAATLLSDERFARALRDRADLERKLEDAAKRAATHLRQRRRAVDAASLVAALPPRGTCPRHPVLTESHEWILREVVACARHSMALWHLACELVDPSLREMSFRDFCVASLALFAVGHNVPDEVTGEDCWIVRPNPVVCAYPVDDWSRRQMYPGTPPTKITAVMRRAEARVKAAIGLYVSRRRASPAYLNYRDLGYDALPESSFVGARR